MERNSIKVEFNKVRKKAEFLRNLEKIEDKKLLLLIASQQQQTKACVSVRVSSGKCVRECKCGCGCASERESVDVWEYVFVSLG